MRGGRSGRWSSPVPAEEREKIFVEVKGVRGRVEEPMSVFVVMEKFAGCLMVDGEAGCLPVRARGGR